MKKIIQSLVVLTLITGGNAIAQSRNYHDVPNPNSYSQSRNVGNKAKNSTDWNFSPTVSVKDCIILTEDSITPINSIGHITYKPVEKHDMRADVTIFLPNILQNSQKNTLTLQFRANDIREFREKMHNAIAKCN